MVPVFLDEKDEIFQKNIKCFPEYIRKQLQMADFEESAKTLEITFTKEGYPLCHFKQDGIIKSLNSRKPWDEAKHWCSQLPLEQMSTVFVYGCGFGYTLVELLKRVHEDTLVVVFEQNIGIFMAMLHYFDLEPVFRLHHKCIFFLGSFEDFSHQFQMLIVSNQILHLTVPSVLFTPSSRIFKKEYQTIQTQVFEKIIHQITAFGNDHYDSLLGFHNIIGNVEIILKNPYLSRFKNKFANVPAFIVANGPSLDQSLPLLHKLKDKGLILCCESAIVPLMKNEIKPDAICVLERIPESYLYHFQNKEYPEDIALLALSVADPRTFTSFAGPKIPVFRSLESTSQWFNQIIGDGSGLYAGLNVSHLAYELAVYMGANPIVLIGQNFAYGSDGLTHSKHSKYAEEGKDYIEKIKTLPIVYVEGNDGSILPSNPIWVQSKKGLEQMIEFNQNITVVNTTEGGAKIKGAIFQSLDKVIEELGETKLTYKLHTLINDMQKDLDLSGRENKIKRLKSELKKHIDAFGALDQLTAERRFLIERLIDPLNYSEVEEYEDTKELRRQYVENNKHLMKFLQSHVHHLFFQQVILYGFHQLNELGTVNTLEKLRYALQIQFQIFDYLSLICQSLIRNYQFAFEKLIAKEET